MYVLMFHKLIKKFRLWIHDKSIYFNVYRAPQSKFYYLTSYYCAVILYITVSLQKVLGTNKYKQQTCASQ